MQSRILGKTGLKVNRLGVGLAELGHIDLDDTNTAAAVLNTALDNGINFLDTAACYNNSEEWIGRTVAHRRSQYILATKCGHIAGDYQGETWSTRTIRDSIDRSLERMRTDYLDLVQLHSCSVELLQEGSVIRALLDAQQEGKTRFIGYSGDNESARWAVESGFFDTLQTSFNIVDQQAHSRLFRLVRDMDMGLICKRPLANTAWGQLKSPEPYADEYFRRYLKMNSPGPVDNLHTDPILAALGFTWSHEEIDVLIVGTANPQHMLDNIRFVNHDPKLDLEVLETLYKRFEESGENWIQQT